MTGARALDYSVAMSSISGHATMRPPASDPGSLAVTVWQPFRGEYLRLLEERARCLEQRRAEAAEQAVAEERSRPGRGVCL